nr:basic amino acid ABC transporter substrate-binding protein [uncultured Leptotrichia sp.]
MKKILAVVMMLMLAVLSCGKKTDSKTLRVGLNSVFAPFEYKENGQIVGFDVDLINQIGKDLGYKIEIEDQAFDGLIPTLKAGKIDMIISGMTATEERKKSVDFSDEYFKSTNVYLKKKGNNNVTSINNLSGKKVGASLGTIQEIEARKIPGATVVPIEDTVKSIMDLEAGKVDVLILENVIALEYMKKYTDLEVIGEKPLDSGMAIAFDKGKHTELIQKINEELKTLKSNGKYNELINKYGLKVKK